MSLKIPTGKDVQTHLLLKCLEVDIKMEGKKEKKEKERKKKKQKHLPQNKVCIYPRKIVPFFFLKYNSIFSIELYCKGGFKMFSYLH